ncbi:MAG: phosphatase PAP2 family protein [Spirochaetales bacterium]|nr:phosphatase PAP2 family protein [Spirochaetales bacterium]
MSHEKLGKALLIIAAVLFAAFIGFTYFVMTYDKAPVGFESSEIGFSHINVRFHNVFGFNEGCYQVTEYLGYICLAVAAANAVIALRDFIRAKYKIRRMHRRYILTMVFYAAVVAFYVLFEFFKVNYRPIAMEASYPSSHTMLGLCVMFSEIALLHYSARRLHFWVIIFQTMCFVCMAAMVVFRLLSGVHWITDIAGSVLLSASLIFLYWGSLVLYGRHHRHHG